MIIGIDASRSNIKQKTGTEYYSYEIIKGITRSKKYKFRLYSKTPINYLPKSENIENKVMRFPRLWSQFRLSLEIFLNSPDVLFEPAHTIPLYHGKKVVVTLHDVGFRYYPQLYTPLERYYHHFCMAFSVKHATQIIAVSNATKEDLVKLYKADKNKITVIYHGFDQKRYKPIQKDEKVSPEIKKYLPYIYFIGRLEAKKNVKKLVRAYGNLRRNYPNIRHKLVLAGRPGYQYEEIKDEILNLPPDIQKDVIETGYVPDDIVSNFMRFASVFAFPSNFEGFGMPLLEAMASGVPIVASDKTSIPEVVQDAGYLCDPDDTEALEDGLAKVILDHKYREELIKKGLKRAKFFSWEKAAEETLKVIEKAAQS